MSEKLKKSLAAVAALGALALGGSAIANATGGAANDQPATAEHGQADAGEAGEAADAPDSPGDAEEAGNEAAGESSGTEAGDDGDGELPAAAEQRARVAAEQATGGAASGDVEPAEQADPVEDPEDQPTPKGAAYEVEITKNGQALKVFLDSSFKEIATQADAG